MESPLAQLDLVPVTLDPANLPGYSVVAGPTALNAAGLRKRCAVFGGDMLESVPAGADLGERGPAATFDILMLLANTGGRIRTEAEFRELFARAGRKLDRLIPTGSPNVLLE